MLDRERRPENWPPPEPRECSQANLGKKGRGSSNRHTPTLPASPPTKPKGCLILQGEPLLQVMHTGGLTLTFLCLSEYPQSKDDRCRMKNTSLQPQTRKMHSQTKHLRCVPQSATNFPYTATYITASRGNPSHVTSASHEANSLRKKEERKKPTKNPGFLLTTNESPTVMTGSRASTKEGDAHQTQQ